MGVKHITHVWATQVFYTPANSVARKRATRRYLSYDKHGDMIMVERIEVTIPPFGPPKIEVKGFTGSSCETATAGIEAALGGMDGNKVQVQKPEYNETSTDTEQHVGQGW